MKRSIPPIERTVTKELILRFVRVGYHHRGAAEAAGIHRATLYRWLSFDAPFASRFGQAWEEGAKRREFLAWCALPRLPPANRQGHPELSEIRAASTFPTPR
jgi:hypothetical protein